MPETFDPSWEYYVPDSEVEELFKKSEEITNEELVVELVVKQHDRNYVSMMVTNSKGNAITYDKKALAPVCIKSKEPTICKCLNCAYVFNSDTGFREYCTRQCRYDYLSERGLLRTHHKNCKVCDREYTTWYEKSTTCSLQCRSIRKKEVCARRRIIVEKACERCSKIFKTRNAKQRRCSRSCLGKIRDIPDKACLHCSKVFSPYRKELKFCSTVCAGIYNNKQKIHIYTKNCHRCGREFKTRRNKRIQCSKKCNGGIRQYGERACISCNKIFLPSVKTGKYCTKECCNEHQKRLAEELRKQQYEANSVGAIHPCHQCGKEIPKYRSNKIYCCKLCNQNAQNIKFRRKNNQ